MVDIIILKILIHPVYILTYIKTENFRRKKFRRKNFGRKTFGQIFKFRRKNFRTNIFKRKNFRTGGFNNILSNFSLRLKGNDSEGCKKMVFFTQDIYFLNKKHFLNSLKTMYFFFVVVLLNLQYFQMFSAILIKWQKNENFRTEKSSWLIVKTDDLAKIAEPCSVTV